MAAKCASNSCSDLFYFIGWLLCFIFILVCFVYLSIVLFEFGFWTYTFFLISR